MVILLRLRLSRRQDLSDSFFVLNHCATVLILLIQDCWALFVDLGSTKLPIDATDLPIMQLLQKLLESVDILVRLEFDLIGETGALFVADGM